jgi:hypothetical protein
MVLQDTIQKKLLAILTTEFDDLNENYTKIDNNGTFEGKINLRGSYRVLHVNVNFKRKPKRQSQYGYFKLIGNFQERGKKKIPFDNCIFKWNAIDIKQIKVTINAIA